VGVKREDRGNGDRDRNNKGDLGTGERPCAKPNAHIRIVGLPGVSELCKASIGDIRSGGKILYVCVFVNLSIYVCPLYGLYFILHATA
jgi:hypothetical protein